VNDELGGIISEETVLMGLWGEEARRDMLEYSERVTKTADHRIKVADLNWFRSNGVASHSGLKPDDGSWKFINKGPNAQNVARHDGGIALVAGRTKAGAGNFSPGLVFDFIKPAWKGSVEWFERCIHNVSPSADGTSIGM
jgi:hypothetical protein